jgi:hypothetical protein
LRIKTILKDEKPGKLNKKKEKNGCEANGKALIKEKNRHQDSKKKLIMPTRYNKESIELKG